MYIYIHRYLLFLTVVDIFYHLLFLGAAFSGRHEDFMAISISPFWPKQTMETTGTRVVCRWLAEFWQRSPNNFWQRTCFHSDKCDILRVSMRSMRQRAILSLLP